MKRVLSILTLAALAGCAMAPQGPPPAVIPVFFQPWSANLDTHALAAVAAAAQQAQAGTGRVAVTGAADSTGSVKANRYLSETRAQVVADQLEADGVSPGRIRMHGVGVVSAAGVPNGAPAQFSRRVLIQIGQ